MAAPYGLTRGRIALIAGGVLILAALFGLLRWGDGAVRVDQGGLSTTRTSAGGAWAGFSLANDSDFPVTLKEFRPADLENAEVVRALVVRFPQNQGWLVLTPPLSAEAQAVVDAGRPLDGFVVPARSDGQYGIVYLLRPVDATRSASVSGGVLVYSSVTMIGHTARTGSAVCLRAAAGACPSAD